jgi:hypothetical protein
MQYGTPTYRLMTDPRPAARRLRLSSRTSFTGTSVRWIGERGFGTGVSNVSIDGLLIGRVDTSTVSQEGYQAVLFSATGLASGAHTLTIEVVGRNNEPPGAAVERVVIDAFDVY